jgi:hypothetical protein
MSRFFKETITNLLTHGWPHDVGTHSFLQRLCDDSDRCIDRIWQSLLDSGQPDNSEERAAFVRCLRTVWRISEAANQLAVLFKTERDLEKAATLVEKSIAKTITDEKAARKDKVARVTEAGKLLTGIDNVLAKFDYKSWDAKELALLDIRSDRDGSRQRTAFMRGAGSLFHDTTGEWHDDWVVDLATLAFPDYKGPKGEGFTVDTVISARRGVRSWPWPKKEG